MKKLIYSILGLCIFVTTLTLKAQIITNYTTADGLPNNNVNCLAQDASGNIWFGTQDGIAKFDGVSSWDVYNRTTHPGLVDNSIKAIAIDSKNNVWVGTDFGVSFYDGNSFNTYTSSDGLGNNRINYITEAPNGDIWFGEKNGVTIYDGTNFISYDMSNGIPFGGINYIDFDSKGDAYMAHQLSGMIHFDGTTFTIYNAGFLNGKTSTTAITIDASDNKWIGTETGITVFDNNNTAIDFHEILIELPAPHSKSPVVDLKVNSKGDIWTGVYANYLVTEGGVATNNGGSTWTDYQVADGLVGPVVKKIVIDANDNVWIATSSGVSKISFSLVAVKEVNFTESSFNLYPNPVSNILNVSFNNNNEPTQSIELYTVAMQLIKEISIDINQKNVTLSVSGVPNGIYFVKAGSSVERILINN